MVWKQTALNKHVYLYIFCKKKKHKMYEIKTQNLSNLLMCKYNRTRQVKHKMKTQIPGFVKGEGISQLDAVTYGR